MRYLLLALVIGCVPPESNAKEEPGEAELALAISSCPVGTWCVETAPVTGAPLLHAVWAVDAGDVFAVGDAGTILRRTHDAWTAMASGTTQNLRGVWAASSSDVWATGVGGTILHFDGTAWSPVAGATSDVDAVWGSGPNDVWFAGSGTVLRWNGAAFTRTGFGGTMLAISGTGPSDVWVTGENTNLHHFTGSSWTTVNPGAGTSSYFTVLALATNDVWAGTFMPGKETMHWTGGARWVAQRTSSAIFNGMSALAPNDIWGAGGNRVGHWNGTAWTNEQPFGTNVTMWSITTAPGHVWLVGGSALIAHRAL